MTASPWWLGLDDAALVALGSAGLLRRAKAARVGTVTIQGATAEVEVEGFTVTLGAKGIGSARCPCPATGLCLHVIAALLALQSEAPAHDLDVAAEIADLSDAEILAFAGSDLAAALRLVEATPPPDRCDRAASLTVPLPGLLHPVTFLAGAGLRGAVWKGPDSRRRLAVTAAALALRAARGLPLPRPPRTEATAEGLDRELLESIAREIEASVAPVLSGYGGLASDRLLDLALSARIESAPRLATALRGLVERAIGLENRAEGSDAAAYLIASARAQALAHALAGPDPDPRLAGLSRRDYRPGPPLTLWLLGARRWQSPTGARGLRLWGWDPEGLRWIATGTTRPDGLDASFDPEAAYQRPMLGLPSAMQAVGQALAIDAPQLSDDLRLSPDSVARVLSRPDGPLPDCADWQDLHHSLWHQMGPTLMRDGLVRPALLAPAACEAPVPGAAGWVLPLRDRSNRLLPVELAGLSLPARTALSRIPHRARLLVETREHMGRLQFTLVSVLHGPQGALVWNPTLDPPPAWPEASWLAQVPSWLGKGQKAGAKPATRALSDDLLSAALDLGQGQHPAAPLALRMASSGIDAVERLLSPPATAAKALRLAWIAADLRRTENGF